MAFLKCYIHQDMDVAVVENGFRSYIEDIYISVHLKGLSQHDKEETGDNAYPYNCAEACGHVFKRKIFAKMMNLLAKFFCRHVESPTNPYNEAVGNLGLQTYLKMLLLDNFIRKLIASCSFLHYIVIGILL